MSVLVRCVDLSVEKEMGIGDGGMMELRETGIWMRALVRRQ